MLMYACVTLMGPPYSGAECISRCERMHATNGPAGYCPHVCLALVLPLAVRSKKVVKQVVNHFVRKSNRVRSLSVTLQQQVTCMLCRPRHTEHAQRVRVVFTYVCTLLWLMLARRLLYSGSIAMYFGLPGTMSSRSLG
jgi:hypothetical protein